MRRDSFLSLSLQDERKTSHILTTTTTRYTIIIIMKVILYEVVLNGGRGSSSYVLFSGLRRVHIDKYKYIYTSIFDHNTCLCALSIFHYLQVY